MDAIAPLSLADKFKPSTILGAGLRHLADLPNDPVGKKLAGAAVAGFTHALDHLAQAEAAETGPPMMADPARKAEEALKLVEFALEGAVQLHEFFASAPPALPGPPAARAPENLPGAEQIRAAYDVITRLH